jgi:outer membrane protein
MTNKNGLLVVWNVVLSLALGWLLFQKNASPASVGDASVAADTSAIAAAPAVGDSNALKDAHIAFFFMDSIQSQFELVQESASRVENEGRRLENSLKGEMQRAKARYTELMGKDHTYSTQAELQADEQELRGLEQRIQQSQADGQEQIDRLQMKMLQEITGEIRDYLEEYNRTAGFDYVFSIQDAGQVWVGNKGLDITAEVVNGLNAKHRLKKAAVVPAGKK